MYIYIYREREMYTHIHIYIYIYTCICYNILYHITPYYRCHQGDPRLEAEAAVDGPSLELDDILADNKLGCVCVCMYVISCHIYDI